MPKWVTLPNGKKVPIRSIEKNTKKDIWTDIEKHDNDGKKMTTIEKREWTDNRLKQLMKDGFDYKKHKEKNNEIDKKNIMNDAKRDGMPKGKN
jgi:hypothetical protein